jgi:hypothetical protein
MLKKIKSYIRGVVLWLTDPTRALQREYGRRLVEARDLQRKGDIPEFARATREAQDILEKIESLKVNKK